MRPPICAVCHREFSLSEGDTVRFADYKPLPEGTVGHPDGLEWFCEVHLEAAERLRDLPSGKAIRRIRAGLPPSAASP